MIGVDLDKFIKSVQGEINAMHNSAAESVIYSEREQFEYVRQVSYMRALRDCLGVIERVKAAHEIRPSKNS